MRSALREQAITLRKFQRMSYSAIQKELKVPKSTLSYWLRDLPLREEEIRELRQISWKKGEAARERFRNTMRIKKGANTAAIYGRKRKEILPITDRDLLFAGLMLYVGEGDKRNPHRIALANADPQVIRLFTKWLQEILKIPREKIRFGLHLYSNMNIAKEVNFWQDTLGFEKESFYKNQVRPVNTPFSYTDGNRHGTCTVYVIGSKPKTELMQMIQVVFDNIMSS